jgi:hypothetical protein
MKKHATDTIDSHSREPIDIIAEYYFGLTSQEQEMFSRIMQNPCLAAAIAFSFDNAFVLATQGWSNGGAEIKESDDLSTITGTGMVNLLVRHTLPISDPKGSEEELDYDKDCPCEATANECDDSSQNYPLIHRHWGNGIFR